MADARASYRVEWRNRSRERDGREREVTRARVVADATELKALAATVAEEAVSREFLVELAGGGEAGRRVCVRAEELAAWAPVTGELPRGVVQTYWLEDEQAGAQRYRLLGTIAAAFDEARSLRLVGRHESRAIMARVRGALLRA